MGDFDTGFVLAHLEDLHEKVRKSGLADELARGEIDGRRAGFLAAGFAMEVAERAVRGGVNKKNFAHALLEAAKEGVNDTTEVELWGGGMELLDAGLDRALVWAAQNDNELRRSAMTATLRCLGSFLSSQMQRKRDKAAARKCTPVEIIGEEQEEGKSV